VKQGLLLRAVSRLPSLLRHNFRPPPTANLQFHKVGIAGLADPLRSRSGRLRRQRSQQLWHGRGEVLPEWNKPQLCSRAHGVI